MPHFNSHVSQLIKDKFDIEIGVHVVIESVEFFLEDYLERFPIKCIYGVDLSLNVLNFDNTIASGSNNFYGKTKEIGYYDAILTDLELEYLTSYRSWESMVNELNLNIIYNG